MSVPAYVAFKHSHSLTNVHGLLDNNRVPYTRIEEDILSDIDEEDLISITQSNLPENFKVKVLQKHFAIMSPETLAKLQLQNPMLHANQIHNLTPSMIYNNSFSNITSKIPMQIPVNQQQNRQVGTQLPKFPIVTNYIQPPPTLYYKKNSFINLNLLPALPSVPWFNPNGVSKIEETQLKDVIPGIRACTTATMEDVNILNYVNLRNVLIDVYRSKPNEKLSLAKCRKHCDGDLSSLIKLLSFMEIYRLINYALDPPSTSGNLDQNLIKLREELANYWNDAPTCAACDKICLYSFYVLNPNLYGSCLPFNTIKTTLWCPPCAKDAPHAQCLIKVNLPTFQNSNLGWSEQQIYALLDAIELHGTNWFAVSEAVNSVPNNPTRSQRECLALFLTLPASESASTVYHKVRVKVSDPETEKFNMKLLEKCIELIKNDDEYIDEKSELLLKKLINVTQSANNCNNDHNSDMIRQPQQLVNTQNISDNKVLTNIIPQNNNLIMKMMPQNNMHMDLDAVVKQGLIQNGNMQMQQSNATKQPYVANPYQNNNLYYDQQMYRYNDAVNQYDNEYYNYNQNVMENIMEHQHKQ